MTSNFRNMKIWILITLCSFFIYSLYWLVDTLQYTWGTYLHGARDPYFYRLSSAVGVSFRFVGAILALFAIYLVWRNKENLFPKIKKLAAVAILFEGIYYLSFLPSVPRLVYYGEFYSLATSYSLQILLTFPLLTVLSLKVWRKKEASMNTGLLKWIGAASLGYIVALWVNNVPRWSEMVTTYGVEFIFAGNTYVGFFNGILTMSLSLFFALVGFISLLIKGNMNKKWWGISLVMLGLHFLIYLLYSIYVDAVSFALLNEIWTIPISGLGIAILRLKD